MDKITAAKTFSHKLVTGKANDHEKLAMLIAHFMAHDNSVPNIKNDRSGWYSDELFRKRLEIEIVQKMGKNKDLLNLADVCNRAQKFDILTINPFALMYLRLAEFSILRRINPPNLEALNQLLIGLIVQLDQLPNDMRKTRLSSLLNYNLGIYFRDVNVNYKRSYESQRRSAIIANNSNDPTGEAIARFCMAYDRLNLALQKGIFNEYQPFIKKLRKKAFYIIDTFVPDQPTERVWKYLNVPVHVIFCQFWTGVKYRQGSISYFRNILEELSFFDYSLFKNRPSLLDVCMAIENFPKGNVNEKILEKSISDLSDVQTRITAILVKARIAYKNRDTQKAKTFYKLIIDGNHNLEQVRAVAKREFGRITQP